jgi:hypothetical protein
MNAAAATLEEMAEGPFAQAMGTGSPSPRHIALDAENVAGGLGRLALTIVNLLHELLERQAIRRMENGSLSDSDVERLGDCLMKQSEAIDSLCDAFGVSRHDLNIDLGPLGRLL